LSRTSRGDADEGLLIWVVEEAQEVFEKHQLAIEVMVVAVVLALSMARAGDKD
jgi:hypothetical protein